MPDAFHQHIRAALADPVLQSALDKNAERRVTARLQALEGMSEDAQTLRRRAHAVRQETISNLDSYLSQFIQHAQENGFIIHRAGNAEQAIQIVLEIAREHHAGVIAKSKTMVSEEIELNQALEQAGLHPIETDLGEFIVQLRGERPAHLITPAVHLRRAEVGQTFHEKLGIPLTEDIPALIAAARQVLRKTFLEAQIGISGVNFGVCETGGICLVSNEGNARMIATLPPVHIALMGIERLVPDLDGLALMLNLLPRSATGQKLTVYTSLIHAPRRPGDPDGPQERHLILLDNGREAVRHSPLAEALLCIRCGACLNACPIFREIGGHGYVNRGGQGTPYSGPIGSVLSPGLFGQAEFGQLARASTLCGACQEACPVDIDLPGLLLRVRAGGIELGTPNPERNVPPAVALGLRVYAWFASHPGRFHLALRLASLAGRLMAPRSDWMHLPAMTGWGFSKDFPRPARHPFRETWANEKLTRETGDTRPVESHLPRRRDIESQSADEPAGGDPDLTRQFAGELEALGGIWILCQKPDLAGLVLDALRSRGIDSVLAWEDELLPGGLLDALRLEGIQVSSSPDATIRAGLTGAEAGIADTGTILLSSGSGRPQTASLLPEVHLAILEAKLILPDLRAALRMPRVIDSQAAVLISGPSRTADIEMTLTIGVHGPGELLVFCLE